MKPTKKQQKEFWGKCGLTPKKKGKSTYWYNSHNLLEAVYVPPITLDNLFKYAVPPLPIKYRHPILEKWVLQLTDNYEEDILALFWAIMEVNK